MATYGMKVVLQGAFDDIKANVVDALKEQGFGILTQIDVQKTLKEKVGAELERYEILGACNPALAQKALEADRNIGLLLPCNVVLRELKDGVEVNILDPEKMFELAGEARAALATLPSEAKRRLEQVLHQLRP